MTMREVHSCQCGNCQQEMLHSDQQRHREMNLFLSRLDEQQRRWYLEMESNRIGAGGDRILSQMTGMDEKTIQRGRLELADSLVSRPSEQVRLPGGGRHKAEKKTGS